MGTSDLDLYIGYDFGTPTKINFYKLATAVENGDANRTWTLKSWRFEGSNDGTSWTTIHTETNFTPSTWAEQPNYTLTVYVEEQEYSKYRLYMVRNNGENGYFPDCSPYS